MSIQQTSTASMSNGNPVVPRSSLSSNDSSSSQHEEPQAKAPLSPSSPSTPITPGSISSTSRSLTRKSKKSVKKSVRFNQAVMARPALHKNNYTAKETAATWYSAQEFEGIRKDVLKSLSLIKSGNLVEPEDYFPPEADCDDASTVATQYSDSQHAIRGKPSLQSVGSYRGTSSKGTTNIYDSSRTRESCVSTARGLENYTSKGSIKSSVRKLRQKAVWAVMEEQDEQVDHAECLQMTYLWYDDEAIRDIYRKHSKPAQRAARQLGVADSENGTEPATMPRRSSRGKMMMTPTKKTLRKLFQKSGGSDHEKTLIEKAAAAFPEKSSRLSAGKQKRWSLKGYSRRGSLSTEGPRSPAAQVA